MDKALNMALVGASGVVGQKILQLLEKKEIKIERRCMQINYVTFPTSWPING